MADQDVTFFSWERYTISQHKLRQLIDEGKVPPHFPVWDHTCDGWLPAQVA